MTQDGWALRYSDALQGDREIVRAAVTQNGHALQYASNELRGDREIVLAAVTQNGYALQDASRDAQNDREIVTAAVNNQRRVIRISRVPCTETWWHRPGPIHARILLRHMQFPFDLPEDLQAHVVRFVDNDNQW